MPNSLLLANGFIFDGNSTTPFPADVLVRDGRILEVDVGLSKKYADVTVDLKGNMLMPGLIDAHVHAYCPDLDPLVSERMPMTLVAHHARRMLESCLARGFTTVRDCGGAEYGLASALNRGWIAGPRLFYCGHALSQTGGHGDKRSGFEIDLCGCSTRERHAGFKGHRTWVVDGADAVRAAVREELRHGASFVKIMASGGASTPADALQSSQYSDDEIRAAVDEATRHDTYVAAHAHPDGAIRRCIELGVACIEHGTLITDDTASLAASRKTYVVPTLATIEALRRFGNQFGFPEASQRKITELAPMALASVEKLKKHGVSIGFGTDLIGPLYNHQCLEFSLRSELLSPYEVLRSATHVNARILRVEDRLGVIGPGYEADLIVVKGNPLEDLSVFTEDGHNVLLVLKGGNVMKNHLKM